MEKLVWIYEKKVEKSIKVPTFKFEKIFTFTRFKHGEQIHTQGEQCQNTLYETLLVTDLNLQFKICWWNIVKSFFKYILFFFYQNCL